MKLYLSSKAWWGAPKSFSSEIEERKISWLELFYDLVYVLAISKITLRLGEHLNVSSLLNFIYFFSMIFWGWLNGSFYHDLHAASGLRTRLITLWQMLIVAGLVITIASPSEHFEFNVTISLMVMQLFITYLWWSVGLYDKDHRKLNKPYTIFYIISFGLIVSTLFLDEPYRRIVFFITLISNYLPPFVSDKFVKRELVQFSLSSSMSERLGLFAIIVFGEVMSGVISGVSQLEELNVMTWVNFALSVVIVFSLWWIFFTLISDRKCKPGSVNSSLLSLLYIPTLIALGLIAIAFGGLFKNYDPREFNFFSPKLVFGFALGLFLLGVNFMMNLLEYPNQYAGLKKQTRIILYVAIVSILAITALNLAVSLLVYLLIYLSVILAIIFLLNFNWYSIQKNNTSSSTE